MAEVTQGLWAGRVHAFSTLPSTNTWACEHAGELGHGDVVWARAQTAGRGRLDRSWLAVRDASLTFSCVLRDPVFQPLGPNLGQVAACAVKAALDACGVTASLKWPNDVLVDDRKIAGILVEMAGAPAVFVVGIGINISVPAGTFAAAGLERPAISLSEAAGRVPEPGVLLAALLRHLQAWLDRAAGQGFQAIRPAWAAADWLAGHEVEVQAADGRWSGRYAGLDDQGRLRLVRQDGETVLWSGDVERVRRAGR